jgi:hypothetical protein
MVRRKDTLSGTEHSKWTCYVRDFIQSQQIRNLDQKIFNFKCGTDITSTLAVLTSKNAGAQKWVIDNGKPCNDHKQTPQREYEVDEPK